MAVRLKWLPKAEADLHQALAYIRTDNPEAAARLGAAILERVERLRDFPENGRVVPRQENPAIREIIFRNFRIVYRFSPQGSTVEIVRIWHGARGTPDLS
jgi:plasmid stabilization system protein ParE